MKLLSLLVLAGCASHAAPDELIAYIVPASSTARTLYPVGDIYTVKPDGSRLTRLTTAQDYGFAAWSIDGKRIAFASLRSGQSEVYVMDADGSHELQVSTHGGLAPSWSPDDTIVFTGGGANGGLSVVGADGTNERVVDDSAYFGSFSTDGTKIVFTGKVLTDRAHNEIFTMDADGSNIQQITFPDQDANAPDANAAAWSPDGTQIAFFCGYEGDLPDLGPYYDAGYQQVCVANSDGTNRHRLTACTGCGSDNPLWSPDGTQVAFDRGYTATGMVTTYVINLDGTREHQLLPISYGGGRRPWR